MWRLELICCGRENGHVARETWIEADEFRKDYIGRDEPKGYDHERSAILTRDHIHTEACNGYSDACPEPGAFFRAS